MSRSQTLNNLLMQDHWGTIIFLIIVFFCKILEYTRAYSKEKQTIESRPENIPKTLAPELESEKVCEEKAQLASAHALVQTVQKQPALASIQSRPHSSNLKSISQKQTLAPRVRLLSQYSGWKRAIVMSELIRPYKS